MRITLLLVFAAIAGGQPRFEVASVRPADPEPEGRKVFRTDPPNIALERESLLRLVQLAYGVDFDQISGPSWIESTYYSVNAKAPSDTTTEDLRSMWQTLLAERFHLRVHSEPKNFETYELTVTKDGPKFRESAGEVLPGDRRKVAVFAPRNVKLTFRYFTMKDLAAVVAIPLSQAFIGWRGYLTWARVTDNTGLTGRYDFELEFAGKWMQGGAFLPAAPAAEPDTASDLFGAVIQQLGLKLTQKKTKLNAIVVDEADKIPTGN